MISHRLLVHRRRKSSSRVKGQGHTSDKSFDTIADCLRSNVISSYTQLWSRKPFVVIQPVRPARRERATVKYSAVCFSILQRFPWSLEIDLRTYVYVTERSVPNFQNWYIWKQANDLTFLARDVIYTSRAYAMMSVSVCLSVTEVHWRIIANLGFKFRSQFTAHCGRGACGRGRDHRREEWRDHLALC